MIKRKRIWYVEAIIEVPIILKVAANDEQEAFARANDGAWHGVISPDYDKAKIKAVGRLTEGPGING